MKFLKKILLTSISLVLLFLVSCEDEELTIPEGALDPVTITVTQFNSLAYEGLLVRLENVQFQNPDELFNGTASNANGSRTVIDCATNTEFIVFTDSDSEFSDLSVPDGNGALVGIASSFNGNPQLLLRSEEDWAALNNTNRCIPGTIPNCDEKNGDFTNICHLRNLYLQGETSIPANTRIRATVISDRSSGAWNESALTVQDATAGISFFLGATHSFDMGAIVEIDVSGASFDEFFGLVQVENVSISDVSEVGTETPEPKIVTIAEFNTGIYESQLVTIQNITYADAGETFSSSTSYDISDTDSNSTVVRIQGSANYAGETIPTGVVNVTGVGAVFSSTRQIIPRNVDDL